MKVNKNRSKREVIMKKRMLIVLLGLFMASPGFAGGRYVLDSSSITGCSERITAGSISYLTPAKSHYCEGLS